MIQLTWPNLIGYIAVLWLLQRALVHVFAVRDLRKAVLRVEHKLTPALQRALKADVVHTPAVWKRFRQLLDKWGRVHPSAQVVARLLDEPAMAKDEIAVFTWIDRAVEEVAGDLHGRMERLRGLAPVVGVLGTVSGLIVGSWLFGQGGRQEQMLGSVALALVTTFGAGIVTLIVRWQFEATLVPLEQQCRLHAQESAARARVWLAREEARRRTLNTESREARPMGHGPEAALRVRREGYPC